MRPRALHSLSALLLAGLLAASLTAPPPALAAAETYVFSADELALREELEERFDVLLLRSGVALRPSSSLDGIDAVEVAAGAVAIDGETVDEPTLRRRIGSAADAVLALARMGDDRGRALLSRGGPGLPAERPVVAGEWEDGVEAAQAAAEAAAEEAVAIAEEEIARQQEVAEEIAERARDRAEEIADRARERAERARTRSDARVAVGSGVQVAEDEVAEDVVAVGGSVTVDGTVHGSAVAVGGSARINGKVTQDVVAVGGRVTLGPGSEVLGDVTSVGGRVLRDPTARVYGQVSEISLGEGLALGFPWLLVGAASDGVRSAVVEPLEDTFELLWALFTTLVLLLLVVLARLLAPGPVELAKTAIQRDAWKAALVGLLAAILFLPLLFLVILVLMVSIIGIPLLVLVPFAILAVVIGALVGFAAVAECIGEWLRDRFGWHDRMARPQAALAVGVLSIQVTSLVGGLFDIPGGAFELFAVLFGLCGFVIKLGAWLTGLGAALQTRLGWRRREPQLGVGGPWPPAPIAPVPPAGPGVAVAPTPADLGWESPPAAPGDDVAGEPDDEAGGDLREDTDRSATSGSGAEPAGPADEEPAEREDDEPTSRR